MNMKKLELILSILAIIAVIMKIFLLPWSAQIFIFAMMGLCLIYMSSAYLYQDTTNLKEFFKQIINTQKKLRYFGTGFSTILIGCLFKLSFWEHSNTIIITGLSIITVSLAVHFLQRPHLKIKMIMHRAIIIGGIGLIVYSIPLNAIIDVQHRSNPEYAKLLKKSFKDPDNKEILDKLYKLQEEIDQ